MTRIPDPVRRGVERALARTGAGDGVEAAHDVGGGCINLAARVVTSSGRSYFLKWNADAPARMFPAERDGLRALAAPGVLRVPEVVGLGGGGEPGDPSWLLLEYVRAGSPGPDYGERLGRGLAGLHREGARAAAAAGVPGSEDPGSWGWGSDNLIGSLPQANDPASSWADFWRERRILPQLRTARDRGLLAGEGGRILDEVVQRMDGALAPPAREDGPTLVHGDLWGGNVFADEAGRPVLIDPAVYRGHREVDLAMSELFGGFPARFRDAYREAWPLSHGYPTVRRPLYQLYYLLVHVNLFGSGYVGRTLDAARSARAAL